MNELRAITIFVEVANIGSFRQVALSNGITAQAVSKAIRQLEHHLGIRLFHRTTRSITLTEDGKHFLESVTQQLEGLQHAIINARRENEIEQGLIRVAAAGPVGRKILIPLIAEFSKDHPLIDFDIRLEESFSDLVSDRIDVVFRASSQPEMQVIARKLFNIQDIVCASPAYLLQNGIPNNIDQIINHRCTGYRSPSIGRVLPWELNVEGDIHRRNVRVRFSVDDSEAEMEAVVAGLGIGSLDSINAAPRIRSGDIVPLFIDQVSDRRGLYICYPHRENIPKRIRLFIDFAVKKLLNSHNYVLSPQELETAADNIKLKY